MMTRVMETQTIACIPKASYFCEFWEDDPDIVACFESMQSNASRINDEDDDGGDEAKKEASGERRRLSQRWLDMWGGNWLLCVLWARIHYCPPGCCRSVRAAVFAVFDALFLAWLDVTCPAFTAVATCSSH